MPRKTRRWTRSPAAGVRVAEPKREPVESADVLDVPVHEVRGEEEVDNSEGEATLAGFIGAEDPAMELIEDFHALALLIVGLEERDRQILCFRFVEELRQSQIGERLGVRQMHVSRLLSRALARLREGLLTTG
ncbi:sigma-70 family RNA polymerase sigma factor [Streptomyces sp. NPDC002889]|uniref:sigma-70 family RNA polymerase sigma factor n=1 Tax=Streptomyces sp. NPDC002889 TaxID=3364669 RepID=UPI0036B51CEC